MNHIFDGNTHLVVADCKVCFSYLGTFKFDKRWKPKVKNKKGLKCKRCEAYNLPEEIIKTYKIPYITRWENHKHFLERRSYLEAVEDFTEIKFSLSEIIKIL